MACPLCASPEGSLINDGIRAGAFVMIVVTTLVIGAMARFAVRLWLEERDR